MIRNRYAQYAATAAVALTPGWSIPFGVGPLWLDIVAGALFLPLTFLFAGTKPFYVAIGNHGHTVNVLVRTRIGYEIPDWAYGKYAHDKTAPKDSYFGYGDIPKQKRLYVANIDARLPESDERVIEAIQKAKECVRDLETHGTEAAQLASRGKRLLKKA